MLSSSLMNSVFDILTWVSLVICPVSNIVSYHQNKELNLDISIEQSSPFPPGDYVITYRITDENSGKSFDIIKDVTVQE